MTFSEAWKDLDQCLAIFLERTIKAFVDQMNTGTVSKAMLGKLRFCESGWSMYGLFPVQK